MLTCLPMKPGELWGKRPENGISLSPSWNLTRAGWEGRIQSPGSSPLPEARCGRDPETGCFFLLWRPVETCRAGYCSLRLSAVCALSLSRAPWTVTCQAPLSLGILQARMLEWVAHPFSRRSSWSRNWTGVSCMAGIFFTSWATRKALAFCWYSVQLHCLETPDFP